MCRFERKGTHEWFLTFPTSWNLYSALGRNLDMIRVYFLAQNGSQWPNYSNVPPPNKQMYTSTPKTNNKLQKNNEVMTVGFQEFCICLLNYIIIWFFFYMATFFILLCIRSFSLRRSSFSCRAILLWIISIIISLESEWGSNPSESVKAHYFKAILPCFEKPSLGGKHETYWDCDLFMTVYFLKWIKVTKNSQSFWLSHIEKLLFDQQTELFISRKGKGK